MSRAHEQSQYTALLREAQSVALLCHVSPDMDTLGSALGLAALLCQGFPHLGERLAVLCADPVPKGYRFLPGTETVRAPREGERFDLAVAVDVSTLERMGACLPVYQGAKARAVLDHHADNAVPADVRLLCANGAATAELVLDLAALWGLKPNKAAAECLFAALSTDTGHFSYSSVSADTLRKAALCLDAGAEPAPITEKLYRTRRRSHLLLLGRALTGARYFRNGQVALLTLTQADREACGAEDGDTEGIVNYGIETDGVRVCALVSERPGVVRASIRSKPGVDASAIAARFGGGGHKLAAGLSLEGRTLAEVTEALRLAMEAAL